MKTRIKHFLSVFVLVGIVALVVEPVRAELVTYYFTGEITAVPDPPPYGLSISVGDPVTGSLAYDPSLGYIQSPPGGMSVVIGGTTVQSAGSASLQVLDDSFGVDNFNGYFTPISVDGQIQPQFSHAMNFSLTDTSQTAFSSADLPVSLNVSSFNIRSGAIFAGSGITVSFSIDTLSLIPPSSAIKVRIDIKPDTFPNSINPSNKGEIAVAILTTGPSDNFTAFDATTVDPTTVRFGPTGTEAAPVHDARKDVDGDGDLDLILHFNTQDTGIKCGNSSASLTGAIFDGRAIKGTDSIMTIGCR